MKTLSFFFFLLFGILITSAQTTEDTPKLSLEDGTISQQFDFINKKSTNYQGYKVVKRTWLNKIKKNINDSLSSLKTELLKANQSIDSQKKEYTALQVKLDKSNNQLDEVTVAKNNIPLFGGTIKKGTFKFLFFSITTFLIIALLSFIFLFKKSNSITKTTQIEFAELEQEFEDSRARALEREQVLNRKLQDELNKKK